MQPSGILLEGCLFLLVIYHMGKFKIREILLFVAVVLLGAIAYEAHKANSQGRYYGWQPLGIA